MESQIESPGSTLTTFVKTEHSNLTTVDQVTGVWQGIHEGLHHRCHLSSPRHLGKPVSTPFILRAGVAGWCALAACQFIFTVYFVVVVVVVVVLITIGLGGLCTALLLMVMSADEYGWDLESSVGTNAKTLDQIVLKGRYFYFFIFYARSPQPRLKATLDNGLQEEKH